MTSKVTSFTSLISRTTARHLAWLLLCLLLPAGTAFAGVTEVVYEGNSKTGEPLELQHRINRYHVNYRVNADYSHVMDVDQQMTVLNRNSIDRAKSRTISFSTTIEKAEIIEAYTLKKGTARIDAPKDNFQVETQTGNRDNKPVFSDRNSITVVFPDVDVGDSTVLKYRITRTEPMFPGQFAESDTFSDETAYDDLRITLDLPDSIKGSHRSNRMTETIHSAKGRVTYEWRYSNPDPKKSERRDYSVYESDAEIGYAFSTYPSYQVIVDSYAARAIPKAAPTDDTRKLAASIIGNEKDPYQQARLLYEWVANNITYAGNCIGVGAVVPHDISFILQNRMGDCKDHSTLLQALLSSAGIKSTQALVNAGSSYSLPAIPVPFSVNHVINYLPAFDLYVDATSHTTPFGLLPMQLYDKPVLLVDGFRKDARIPPLDKTQMALDMTTDVEIANDGSVKGNVRVSMQGLPAANTRAGWRKANQQIMHDWLERMFTQGGETGSARLTNDDPDPMQDSFGLALEFTRTGYIHRPGAGALGIYSPLPMPHSIAASIGSMQGQLDGYPSTCFSEVINETYTYRFAPGMEVLAKPEDLSVTGAGISFSSTLKQEGNTLTIKRQYSFEHGSSICSAKQLEKLRKIALKIGKHLDQQVVYK